MASPRITIDYNSNKCSECKQENLLGKCLECRQYYYTKMGEEEAKDMMGNWMKEYFKEKKNILREQFQQFGKLFIYIELNSLERIADDELEWIVVPYYSLKDVLSPNKDKDLKLHLDKYDVTISASVTIRPDLTVVKSISCTLI